MSAADDMRALKQALREQARAARAEVDPATRATLAKKAARNLLAVVDLERVGTVLVYSAMPEELDPAPFAEAVHAAGKVVALPRIDSPTELAVHAYRPGDELERGPMRILEPLPTAPPVALYAIDVVVVPGVAFDAHGHRLGYGGGFYDRLLPRLRPDCLLVGLAFDEQVFAELPAEDHDRTVDALVTPTRALRFGGGDSSR